MKTRPLPDELLERVLARLGMSRHPDPSPESLRAIYAAWCRRVPFDNFRKLIHLRSGNTGLLPGSTAEDFFEAWLRHGAGGTCWPGAGACQSLLRSLGFEAVRGIGTMLVVPGLPPNHGTVRVSFDRTHFLVDCSILHGEPLRLDESADTRVVHPAWGVRCRRHDGHWHVAWRPLHRLQGLDCRLESFGAERGEFERRYEQTRSWSPFNYELAVRLNRGDDVIGVGFGHAVTLHGDGRMSRKPISDDERTRLLIEDVGLSEELVQQLPADVPTPPPPWSRTAQAGATP
jgi:N-hydroxyarylamine O-acetyltransferase